MESMQPIIGQSDWFISPNANDISSRMRRTILVVLQVAGMVGLLRYQPFDGRLDPRLILAFEVAVIGLVIYRFARIVYRVRSVDLPAGVRGLAAVRQIVTGAFPGPIGSIFLSEIAIWISLWRFVTPWRRSEEASFTYHRQSSGLGMLVVVLLTAPVEILLVELLVPWDPVRWILLAGAIYSIIWFAGMTLAPITFPHGLGDQSLILRNGALTRIDVPFAEVAAIERVRVSWPEMPGRIPPSLVIREGTAHLPGSERRQIRVTLMRPLVVAIQPDDAPVTTIIFTADDPDEVVTSVAAAAGLP